MGHSRDTLHTPTSLYRKDQLELAELYTVTCRNLPFSTTICYFRQNQDNAQYGAVNDTYFFPLFFSFFPYAMS